MTERSSRRLVIEGQVISTPAPIIDARTEVSVGIVSEGHAAADGHVIQLVESLVLHPLVHLRGKRSIGRNVAADGNLQNVVGAEDVGDGVSVVFQDVFPVTAEHDGVAVDVRQDLLVVDDLDAFQKVAEPLLRRLRQADFVHELGVVPVPGEARLAREELFVAFLPEARVGQVARLTQGARFSLVVVVGRVLVQSLLLVVAHRRELSVIADLRE